ncbi:hypothetical protein KKG31_02400 [Patescibacteria group bacterium]|nr:hypothetical protein [Patescibacteria group bacterium]
MNTVVNVLDYVNSGYFDFVPLPCVSDVDAPMFTGYSSGALYNASVDPSFSFVIYDYTGSHVVDYNDTEHYWFTSLPADETNLANYVAVTTEGVDNQYGVNSGSISMYISGVAEIIP